MFVNLFEMRKNGKSVASSLSVNQHFLMDIISPIQEMFQACATCIIAISVMDRIS